MGRNDKSFGVDLDNDAQLLSLIPAGTSSPPATMEKPLALPAESRQADERDPSQAAATEHSISALEKVARDMTLLATLVTRRRHAKSEAGDYKNQALPSDNVGDLSELAFQPVGIAPREGDEFQIVDSVAGAVEYLTAKWPICCGDAFEEALQACVDGIKGRVSPEQVRSAFINAADAAGIRVAP